MRLRDRSDETPGSRSAARFGAALLTLALCGGSPRDATAAELRHANGRVSLTGALAAWDVLRLHDDTPNEYPSGFLDLRLDATRTDRWRLFAAVRTGYDGKIGDPHRGNPVMALDEVYQSKDLYLNVDEAYLELYLENVELRLGKHKVSWGQLDDLQPTDHVNPEDLTEFFFRPELERKIGVPGLRVIGYRGASTVDFVWTPFYTAYRLPAPEDRWFPPLLEVPDAFTTPLGTLPLRTRYPDVDPPPHTLASSDVAIRLRHFHRGIEMSLTAFHGWDKQQQTFAVAGTATVTPTGDPLAPVAIGADATIRPDLRRITVVGADVAMPLWVFALRAEAAWIHGRAFPLLIQRELASDPRLLEVVGAAAARVAQSGVAETVALPIAPAALERESFQYGIGLDWFVTERVSRRLIGREWLAGGFFLLQLVETVIFDHHPAFIAERVEHLFTATFRQTFLDERLGVELKAAYNPNHAEYLVWPQLTYKLTHDLAALFEARIIGGDPEQTIGQYRRHDGIKLGVRYTF